MDTYPLFWWLERPIGQIAFSMIFLMAGLIIVNLFLSMIYLIRLIGEKRFKNIEKVKRNKN